MEDFTQLELQDIKDFEQEIRLNALPWEELIQMLHDRKITHPYVFGEDIGPRSPFLASMGFQTMWDIKDTDEFRDFSMGMYYDALGSGDVFYDKMSMRAYITYVFTKTTDDLLLLLPSQELLLRSVDTYPAIELCTMLRMFPQYHERVYAVTGFFEVAPKAPDY